MSPADRILHTRASVLATAFPQFVSEFEVKLLEEVRGRREAFGDQALLTPAEAEWLRDLVHGLEGSIRRLFSRPDIQAWFAAQLGVMERAA